MILNDTLQKHRECLERCSLEQETCKQEQKDDQKCDIDRNHCERDCDFDYGP